MSDPTYVIGIDLGTTNSVVSYAKLDRPLSSRPQIDLMKIPQTVSSGVVEAQHTLPSFLFTPGPHDVPEGALGYPGKIRVNFLSAVLRKIVGPKFHNGSLHRPNLGCATL